MTRVRELTGAGVLRVLREKLGLSHNFDIIVAVDALIGQNEALERKLDSVTPTPVAVQPEVVSVSDPVPTE